MTLALRIPPGLLVLVLPVFMWLIKPLGPRLPLNPAVSWGLSVGAFVIATLLLGYCAIQFHRARTTVNPVAPEKASQLVITGLYRYSRNPMYVGFVLALASVALATQSMVAWLGPLFFVAFVTQFQIKPEEASLTRLFGQHYLDYKERVRRWL